MPDRDEPTNPGTPSARSSAALRAVHEHDAEIINLRERLIASEKRVRFLEKRVDALVLRVQALEGGAR